MPRVRKPKKPPTTFTPAPAAEALALPIIGEFHKHLNEHNVRVEFLFRSDTKKRLGKTVAATAQKVTSLAAFFGREEEEEKVKPFFAIVISEPIWCHMEAHERRALLDHELMHCGSRYDNDGNVVLHLIGHDLEEFRCIVERHGYWQRDIKLMAASMEKGQGVLPMDGFFGSGNAGPDPQPQEGFHVTITTERAREVLENLKAMDAELPPVVAGDTFEVDGVTFEPAKPITAESCPINPRRAEILASDGV